MPDFDVKRCPFCRETIRAEATFCRYCNHDLEEVDLLRARLATRRTALILAVLFGGFVVVLGVASLLRR